MKRWPLLLPLVLFLGMAAFLCKGLYLDPSALPSALIDKPFPNFSLQSLQIFIKVWCRRARNEPVSMWNSLSVVFR